MREGPILISTGLIPRILDGSKTQTRRVIKPQPEYREYGQGWFWKKGKMVYGLPNQGGIDDRLLGIWQACPYGQVGDRLWVRETFDIGRDNKVFYKADYNETMPKNMFGWKPSIHMPRWASRITLEIIGLRVERLQEITEDDAEAEGESWSGAGDGENYDVYSAVENYAHLWDSLNPKYPWESNPWVWVIEWSSYKEAHE